MITKQVTKIVKPSECVHCIYYYVCQEKVKNQQLPRCKLTYNSSSDFMFPFQLVIKCEFIFLERKMMLLLISMGKLATLKIEQHYIMNISL